MCYNIFQRKLILLLLLSCLLSVSYGQDLVIIQCADGKFGFKNAEGNIVIDCQYDIIGSFSEEGLAPVKLNGKWGYIDMSNTLVIPFLYEDAQRFWEGLAKVQLKGQWGYIDANGKVVIPFRYGIASGFALGVAPVMRGSLRKGGRHIFIDQTGKAVTPMRRSYTASVDALVEVMGDDFIDRLLDVSTIKHELSGCRHVPWGFDR
jgi:hypothetical protein